MGEFPSYPSIEPYLLPRIAWAYACKQRRSFQRDALKAAEGLPLEVLGQPNIPQAGPALVLCNHYTRPGFSAHWIALAISAAAHVDIQWVITAENRYEGRRLGVILRPILKSTLKMIAYAYSFFSMPAMPPRAEEAGQRANILRQIIHTARSTPGCVIGISPEGQDFPGGRLGMPPPGVGRLIAHLANLGLTLHPVGVFERAGRLVVNFGQPFTLDLPADAQPQVSDRECSRQVMQHIAAELPDTLRGDFA